MIQIVKSHFQPENHEVLWIDLSVNPASLKIFRSDGWTSIGVDNEVVSSIIKLLEEQDNNISKLNKTIDTEVLKKKSLATLDSASLENGGNIDLTKTYALKTDVENSLKTINDKIEETFTSADRAKLDGIEEKANKTIVDEALNTESTNPVQNKVITNIINQISKQASQALLQHTDNSKIHANTLFFIIKFPFLSYYIVVLT